VLLLQQDYINRPRPSLRNALASAIDGWQIKTMMPVAATGVGLPR